MSRTLGLLGAAIAALAVVLVGAATAGSSTGSPPATAEEPAAAIVEVETPALPAGRSNLARERWRRLRQRSAGILTAVASRNGLAIDNRIPETGQFTVELGGESVSELRDRLAADSRVQRVQANHPVELRYLPNDPGFTTQAANVPNGDFRQWNLRHVDAPAAWDLSKGGGAEVAVIDTGVSYSGHVDLGPRTIAALDCTGGCSGGDVSDGRGHGTHVAGLACADSDNGLGIASLGFDCNLFAVRIAFCDEAEAGIVAAGNRGSDAINMSFGGCSGSMADELNYAWSRGSVLVAAGDNVPDAPVDYPSQFVQSRGSGPVLDSGRGLVVTAAKYGGARASFAERTTTISVAAYGAATDQKSGGQQGILSTWPAATTSFETGLGACNCRTSVSGNDDFAYLVGTSMAAAQVSGLVALIRAAKPDISNTRIIRLIKETASHCGSYGDGLGWGVVNANRAVAATDDRDIEPPRSRVKRARQGKLTIARSDKPGKHACSDEVPASGVKKVKIFASINGGRYRKIGNTKGKAFRFRGKPGKRYRFYSIAIDVDGNREAEPDDPDEKLRIKRR